MMGVRDHRKWAKEELLSHLDRGLVSHDDRAGWAITEYDLDDMIELRNTRNAIARRWKLPEKTLSELFPARSQ